MLKEPYYSKKALEYLLPVYRTLVWHTLAKGSVRLSKPFQLPAGARAGLGDCTPADVTNAVAKRLRDVALDCLKNGSRSGSPYIYTARAVLLTWFQGRVSSHY